MVDMVRTRLPGHVFSPDYEFPAEKAALMQKICTKTEAGKPNIRRDSIAELARTRQEQMLLLLAGDQDVVLVLALLDGSVAKGRHSVAVLPVVIPLALVPFQVGFSKLIMNK